MHAAPGHGRLRARLHDRLRAQAGRLRRGLLQGHRLGRRRGEAQIGGIPVIAGERVRPLNARRTTGRPFVVYWMQAAQRAGTNHAPENAVGAPHRPRKPLVGVHEGYVRIERRWRELAAAALDCPLVEVATNVIVPVEAVSPKEEYAAATLRPKIYRRLD